MNIKTRLRHLAQLSAKDRHTGRTTLNAKAAKCVNGIVLTASHTEAKNIEREHDVISRSVEINLEGYTGPFFFDHRVVEILLNKAANKIEALESKNERMIKKVEALLKELKSDDEVQTIDDPELPRSGAV